MKNRKEEPAVYDLVAEGEAFALYRNGRYLMTPKGKVFKASSQPLMEAILAEWRAQGEKINAAQMPLTQLMATANDIVAVDRKKIIDGMLAYIGTDLLCHQVDEPPALAEKQQELWQPIIDWCAHRYDISFAISRSVMPVAQSPETTARLRAVFEAHDDLWLAGLSSATDSAGSLILALALAEGEKNAASVFEAAELDVTHQAATWGVDPVTQARQEKVRFDLEACERWFELLKS